MKNVLYILGAGSSKDFGMPLGNEIFQYAYEALNFKKKHGIGTNLKTVLEEVETIMRYIFVNLSEDRLKYPPFEEVLSFIWDSKQDERWDYNSNKLISLFENFGKDAEEVFDNFVKMMGLTIAACMFNYHLPNHANSNSHKYTRFIKSLKFHEENISFISLNYDLILDSVLAECAEEKIIEDYSYGLTFEDIRDKKPCRERGILLFKPHGSLNLSYCPHPHESGFYYSEDNIFTAIKNRRVKCPKCGRQPKPLIIPPLYNKGDYVKTMGDRAKDKRYEISFRSSPEIYRKCIDNEIIRLLTDVDEIIVIGYSMPAYDIDFKSLLMKGLMKNEKRDNILLKIITLANESQIANLKSQFMHLAGPVIIEENNGFGDYLNRFT
jgi:hypothetical protein